MPASAMEKSKPKMPVISPEKAALKASTGQSSNEKTSEIEFDDFMKVDLRIGQIIEAEEIKEADKLLKLKVEIAPNETRQIIAGIKAAYPPEKLIGRKVLVCINLKPRKMKFGLSEGMVLCASAADEKANPGLYVLEPWPGAQPGMRIR